MTHTCCSSCRLRLSGADAGDLTSCPRCGGPLSSLGAADAIGHALLEPVAEPPASSGLAAAVERAARRERGRP